MTICEKKKLMEADQARLVASLDALRAAIEQLRAAVDVSVPVRARAK